MALVITVHQIERLGFVIQDAARVGERAVNRFGCIAQADMGIEEAAEMIVTIRHHRRGRVHGGAVINEAADAIITALQVAIAHSEGYSLTELIEAIATKTAGLRRRVEDEAAHG